MTEEEWRACGDAEAMLPLLRGRASERQLRLFIVACCRRVDISPDDETQAAIDVAERYADGRAPKPVLTAARDVVEALYRVAGPSPGYVAAHIACGEAISCLDAAVAVDAVVRGIAQYAPRKGVEDWYAVLARVRQVEGAAQSAILRDVIGASLGPRPLADPAWLTPATVSLARAAYEEQLIALLPVLADALEDAGCTDIALLTHLRGPGPHVRGCWALDLVLGKS